MKVGEVKIKSNFIKLENKLTEAYLNWNKNKNNKKSSTIFFIYLKDFALSVLKANKYNIKYKGINLEMVAYEYSVTIFERISIGRFTPISNNKKYKIQRFPWFKYVTLSIKKTVYNNIKEGSNNLDLFIDSDIYNLIGFDEGISTLSNQINREFLIQHQDNQFNTFNKILKHQFHSKLYKSLLIFYTQDEIKKLYSISINYIALHNTKNRPPKDIKDFSNILICLAKRLINEYNEKPKDDFSYLKNTDLKKITNSTIKSCIFIAAIMNNNNIFPKELLLSLDINSLYRLCTICGGKKITIPTLETLDSLIGATLVATEKLVSKNPEGTRKIKNKLNLKMKKAIDFDSLVNNILFTISNFTDNSSKPLISTLLNSIKKLEQTSNDIQNNINNFNSEEIIQYYSQLNESLNLLTNSFVSITKIIENRRIEDENAI